MSSQDQQPIPKSYTVGGVRVSCVDLARAVDELVGAASARAGGIVTVTSAHGVVEAQSDEQLRKIINSARMTLADGMPLLWVGKLKKAPASRVSGAEFVDKVMHDARASRLRHYFYGGQPETVRRLVARAAELLGAAAIAGWHCPPLRDVGAIEDPAVMTLMAASKPDIVWVGLSTPKQEKWMANHAALLPGTVLVGVGAAFEFFSGVRSRAPAIIQKVGLEWLYRLLNEPKRLWPRYRRVVPQMLKILFFEAMRR
jgi:N-acetylglucosaminyldiphosphoundecaprenol N-acetyl-beta-D-mannosaminyltransferase